LFEKRVFLKQKANQLRKEMTEPETKLWWRIRNRQIKNLRFMRQKVIGDYIVDFYCREAGVVIEIDGSQHFSEGGLEKDRIRDDFLNNNNLRIFRFNNHEVLHNIESVLDYLYDNL